MPVNGLLLTLSPDPGLADDARIRIAAHCGTELAPVRDRWLPIAVETPDVKSAHEFHEWLESLPGIEHVDVIYVGFDEPSPTAPAP